MEIRPRHLTIAGATLALAIVSLWCWKISQDLPDPQDADLLLPRPPVAHEQNTYAGLGEVLAAAKRLDAGWAPVSWDAARISSPEGRAVYRALDEALARPRLQFPAPGGEDPLAIELEGLAQLLDARSRSHAEAGAVDGAFAEAHKIAVMGQRLASGEGVSLVPAMIGARIEELGYARIRSLLEVRGVSAIRLAGWQRQLGDRPIPVEARARVWAGEYRAFKTQFSAGMEQQRENTPFFLSRSPNGYFYQHNRTLSKIADSFRHYRDAADTCGIEPLESDAEMTAVDYIRPNAVGEILARVASPAYGRHLERFCALEARRVGTLLVLALRAYRLDHGEYPAALTDLVPHYLATLPADPFDGQALRYSRAQMRVWSVGSDRNDSGGERPHDDDSGFREIALPLEVGVEVAELN